jgi:acetyl esterase
MGKKYQLKGGMRISAWIGSLVSLFEGRMFAEQANRDNIHRDERRQQKAGKLHHVEDRGIEARDGFVIPVRVYRPLPDDGLPLLVYYHGGGWCTGSRSSHDGICRAIAQHCQTVVVSVEYRLAPEFKYPYAVHDSFDALLWAVQNAPAIGADKQKVIVAGDSAGGNLAAVMGLVAKAEGVPDIAGQILIYPVTSSEDIYPSRKEYHDAPILKMRLMDKFTEAYASTPEDKRAPFFSPIEADDLSSLPPALVVVAQYDPLHDEGVAYANALKEAGVPVTLLDYDGAIHGFMSFGANMPEVKDALGKMATFVRECNNHSIN